MMNNAVIGSGAQQSDHSILSVHICHLPANIPWVKAFFFFLKHMLHVMDPFVGRKIIVCKEE